MLKTRTTQSTYVKALMAATGLFVVLIGAYFVAARVTPSDEMMAALATPAPVPVELTGKVEVVVADNFVAGASQYEYYLKDDHDKQYALHIIDQTQEVKPNSTIRVSGTTRNQASKTPDIAVDKITTVTEPEPTNLALGNRRIATILYRFQDGPPLNYGVAQANNWMYSSDPTVYSANNFVKEASFNQASVSGTTYGVYTIPVPYPESGFCDYRYWGELAKIRAAQDGFIEGNFDHVLMAGPWVSSSICSAAGYGELCGRNMWAGWDSLHAVAIHELGHNFCADHSDALECTENGARVAYSNTCQALEYWDWFDNMGQAWAWPAFPPHHWNNYWKERIDWLGPANVQVVTADGIYHLKPIEFASSPTDVQALKIPRGDGTYFYLEYRQTTLFDSFTSDYVTSGVTIRKAPVGGHTALIDTTPLTLQPQGYAYDEDAPLAVGRVFEDRTSDPRITVRTHSVSSSEATVEVYFGHISCLRSNPTMAVAPARQTGTRGQALNYHVEIRNEDTASCNNSVFELSGVLPDGLTQSPLAWQSNRLAPGESQSWDIPVTLAANPADPTREEYKFQERVTVSHGSDVYEASAESAYMVCVPVAPFVTLTPITQSGAAGRTLTYSLLIRNEDNPDACAASNFSIAIQLPGPGWINGGTSFPATLSLLPGQEHEITLPVTITPPASIASGQYPFTISATDTINPTRRGAAVGGYIISNPSGKPRPIEQ